MTTSETGTNLLDLEVLGIEFKENFYEINDHKTFVNVKVYNEYLVDNNKEESTTHTKYYNQSIILNFLCHGRNFTDRHLLTWHHFIGDTEVGSVNLETTNPNTNYTLSLLIRSYDNESTIFCTAKDSYTDMIINRTDDVKFKMNDFRNDDSAIIAVCQGNYSDGSSEPCDIGSSHNRAVELRQGIKKEYSQDYEHITPVYYNENFPTVIHKCSKGDNSILRAPDGTARVQQNITFTFDKSDNGTVIYCSRVNSIHSKFHVDDVPNVYKMKRETYNDRVYFYDKLYWNDRYYQNNSKRVNLLTIIIAISGTVIFIAIAFNIVFFVYKRMTKHEMDLGSTNKT